jgi:hypothetical protein
MQEKFCNRTCLWFYRVPQQQLMICVECRWIDTCWEKSVALIDCPPWRLMILCLSSRVWHGRNVVWVRDKQISKKYGQITGRMPIPVARGLRRGSAAACLLRLRVRIPPGHGCLSLVSVVCCRVDVSATGRSFVQRRTTECLCLTESDEGTS